MSGRNNSSHQQASGGRGHPQQGGPGRGPPQQGGPGRGGNNFYNNYQPQQQQQQQQQGGGLRPMPPGPAGAMGWQPTGGEFCCDLGNFTLFQL